MKTFKLTFFHKLIDLSFPPFEKGGWGGISSTAQAAVPQILFAIHHLFSQGKIPPRPPFSKGGIYGLTPHCVLGVFLLPFSLLLAGCNESPFGRTRDASGGGALGNFNSGSALVVFSSELKSGGGAFLYPGGENQTLSFSDTSNPLSARSIRYSWNGQDVAGQHVFAGFDLMHTPLLSQYDATPGRDLRSAGYTKVTFFARGSLSSNTFVKIEVADDGVSTTHDANCVSLSVSGTDDAPDGAGLPCGRTDALAGDWRQYAIPVSPASLNPIKDLFKATFIFTPPFVGSTQPGQGGVVYVDQIQYTH